MTPTTEYRIEVPPLTELRFDSSLRRFLPKIRYRGGCWIWTGAMTKGYSQFRLGRWDDPDEYYGHRASYRMFHGEIPEGIVVMHSCDVPLCVNPAHLSLGTVIDNNTDSRVKGRATVGSKSHYAKLTEFDIEPIRVRRLKGETLRSIADDYGVCQATICNITRRNNWKHVS